MQPKTMNKKENHFSQKCFELFTFGDCIYCGYCVGKATLYGDTVSEVEV